MKLQLNMFTPWNPIPVGGVVIFSEHYFEQMNELVIQEFIEPNKEYTVESSERIETHPARGNYVYVLKEDSHKGLYNEDWFKRGKQKKL